MGRKLDVASKIGLRVGRLVVTAWAGRSKAGKHRFNCKCDCGFFCVVQWDNLRTEVIQSCGCLNKDRLKARATHGLSDTPLFWIWQAFRKRCYCVGDSGYKNYGGRGITVCNEWQGRSSFPVFHKWAMSNGYQVGLEIDRRDNDGPYNPENCRFVTRTLNRHNQRLISRANTSGYCGAHRNKGRLDQTHAWFALCNSSLAPKKLHKSGFKTAIEAARYRDSFCIVNNIPLPLNFPEITFEEANKIIGEQNGKKQIT